MYATKRRRRNVKSYKHQPKENQKSNPSKRHRERLNAELENLANLLPFEQTILTKLDKLSILRLAVSYLRIKSYFQVSLKISNHLQLQTQQDLNRSKYIQQLYYLDPNFSEGSAILESLSGFILIANSNSEVFYSSRTVEQYLGFHQSDIIHQSIYELIHSEDRDEFKKQLTWNSSLPPDKANLSLHDLLTKNEYSKYLNRNFTVRFRCLLDNTSGFVTLDIVGHLGVLYGQRYAMPLNPSDSLVTSGKAGHKSKHMKLTNNNNNGASNQNAYMLNEMDNEQPIIALFAVACPFGPPSLFETPNRDSLFKSKHKVNLAPISLDSRGKLLLGYSEHELTAMGGYDLIHPDDLKYYSNAHKELLKTGSAGLVCYRVVNKAETWQWLQSSMRTIYKSNKPECIIANHRPLTPDEGEELFYKRGVDFKLPYPCLYDFETNFGGLLSNYTNDEIRFSNHANGTVKSANTITSTPHRQSVTIGSGSKTEASEHKTKSTKTTKNTKAAQRAAQKSSANNHNHHHHQHHQQQHQPQLQTATIGGSQMQLNDYQNMMYDPAMGMQQSDYATAGSADYSHYNGYFNTLNGYNYSNYLTDTNKFYNTAAAYQNGFLYNTQTPAVTATNQLNETGWFDASGANTSNTGFNAKVLPNNYQLLATATTSNTNYQVATTSPTSNQANYTDLFNTAVKYNNPQANGYFDDYGNQHHHHQSAASLTQYTSSTPYDYNFLNKYNTSVVQQQHTKSSAATQQLSTFSNNIQSDINNNNNSQNGGLTKKQDKIAINKSTASSTSSSSSTSPSTSIENSYHLQYTTTAVKQPATPVAITSTNNVYLSNSKKYLNENTEKAPTPPANSNHVTLERNSLSSYSASSCSSASSVSNYCDENAAKFIKQESCLVDLPLLNPNNIRSGFIKDYYSDMTNYYTNDVNI